MTKGKRIKQLRELKSINQIDLAKVVDVSKQTLYKYENDIVTNIPPDVIEKLADAFDTTPGYIMGWTESEGSSPAAGEIKLTSHESDLVRAYRNASKDTKTAVCNVLGIKGEAVPLMEESI